MVKVQSCLLSLLSFLPLIHAIPLADDKDVVARTDVFSFEKWADSIIADPEGSHGLPADVSTTLTDSSTAEASPETLSKRQGPLRCNTSNLVASAADAAWCIDFLARRASARCPANRGGVEVWCRRGQANIVGVTDVAAGTSSSCGDVARAAGRIMDVCTRGGSVEGFNTAYGNGNLGIYIRRPQ